MTVFHFTCHHQIPAWLTSECTEHFIEWAKDWQTLIAGIFALIAALIGARCLNRQTQTIQTHERTRRETAENAARAVLPLALTAIIDYAEQSSNILHQLHKAREGERIPDNARRIEVLPVPESAITNLQSMVREATNGEIVKIISKIIQKIQIEHSRMRNTTLRQELIQTNT